MAAVPSGGMWPPRASPRAPRRRPPVRAVSGNLPPGPAERPPPPAGGRGGEEGLPGARELLQRVAEGSLTPEEGAAELEAGAAGWAAVGDFSRLDLGRQKRNGLPEVVFGQGKTPEQVAAIMARLAASQATVLATRIAPEAFEAIRGMDSAIQYHPGPKCCTLRGKAPPRTIPGRLVVVSAGTADWSVAEEVRLTAEVLGCNVELIADVGVAGLHRVLGVLPALRAADVVIVVAGMDGALPSVVSGFVEAPLIAVPTSVGYGAAFEGVAPLLSSLNSCAPGLGVVNIDNGFGAAMLAAKILSRIRGGVITGDQ